MKNCHPKKILASWTLLVNKIPHLPEISRFFFSIKFHSGMSVFLFLYQIESSLIKATNNQSKYSELSYISSTKYQPFELEPSSCIHDKLAPMTLCASQLLLFPIKAKNKTTRKKIKKVKKPCRLYSKATIQPCLCTSNQHNKETFCLHLEIQNTRQVKFQHRLKK